MVDPDNLTDEQLETLLENPEVRKTLEYDDAGVMDIAASLEEFSNSDDFAETYDIFAKSVADRSGRVTESTVKKVITGMVAEANSVRADDNEE